MKCDSSLLAVGILAMSLFLVSSPKSIAGHTPTLSPTASLQGEREKISVPSSIIIPGKSLGALRLGDSRGTLLKLFPFNKDHDSEYTYTFCALRTEIHWLDMRHGVRDVSDISFFLRDDKVFQIESGDPGFRTGNGMTIYASPENIKKNYPRVSTYVLNGSGGLEVGGRDLVYWVDSDRGIAFEFQYFRKLRRRLVSKVIVFVPHSDFFPGGCIVTPQSWEQIPQYSLEPPKR